MGLRHFDGLRVAVFTAALLPALWLGYAFFADRLGPNPFETLTRTSGEWTLRFLLLTLAMSPLREVFGWRWPVRLRRMLGLYAFFYGVLHLTTWLWFEQFFDWPEIGRDILKRPFITALVYPAVVLAVLHHFWLVKADLRGPAIYGVIAAGLLGWRLYRRYRRHVPRMAVRA